MNAEIICIGTELVIGDVLNTSSQYIARKLAQRGLNVFYHTMVGDNPGRMQQIFETAVSRSNLIFITGGLGPTQDDITVQTVCDFFQLPLVENTESLENIKAYFSRLGRELTDNNLKQALVPQGATVFQNALGTAPGCAVEHDGKTVILLPGPPKEMQDMFDRSVEPFLEKYTDGIIRSHFVKIYGIGEAQVDAIMADLESGANPSVAPYAKDGEMYLRVTAKAQDQQQAEQMCACMIEKIRQRVGDQQIYGIDVESLQQVVVDLLKDKGLTVATAESCTAGYISKRITEIPGSSAVFAMGVSTYSNASKQKLLGVRADTLQQFGAVSAQIAAQMAKGVRLLSGADIGLSITGIAGPDSDGSDKPVGLAYIGLSDRNGEYVIKSQKGGFRDREYIRYTSASEALNLLRLYLLIFPQKFENEKFIKFHEKTIE